MYPTFPVIHHDFFCQGPWSVEGACRSARGRQLLVPAALEAAGMESLGPHPRIIDAVRAPGIEGFTEPQERAIPRILAGENVLLGAPTGIGKTEAALLPILDRPGPGEPPPT